MEDMEEFLSRLSDKDIAVRLCVPVADAPDLSAAPGSIHVPCSLCRQACWYDSTMILPLPPEVREFVLCNSCAMHNEALCAVLMAITWPGSPPPSWN